MSRVLSFLFQFTVQLEKTDASCWINLYNIFILDYFVKSIKKMEMTAHFSPSSTSTVRTFDSTDKILDEIDAKLNGVSKFR